MWKFNNLESKYRDRYVLMNEDEAISFGDALELLRSNENFQKFFIAFLNEIQLKAYRWETPPFTKSLLDRDFEFVILNSPSLDRPADSSSFDPYIRTKNKEVVVFQNLGGDAHLVVPTRVDQSANYCHLASFTKSAPLGQQQTLWASVGETGLSLVSDKPVWLSTAGGGVPWLHVRFDHYPKYYGHAEYKKIT